MTDFIYWLNDMFNAFFDVFEEAGNLPNWIFIIAGAALFSWWMLLQKKYNQQAKADPKQLK
ncbi:MAG: DUF6341 family protein [Vicingaceae bacterium]